MHEGDRDRSFTYRRRYAFHISGPNVTNREDSWQTRFKQMRGASKRPVRGSEILGRKIRPGLDEAVCVECDTLLLDLLWAAS